MEGYDNKEIDIENKQVDNESVEKMSDIDSFLYDNIKTAKSKAYDILLSILVVDEVIKLSILLKNEERKLFAKIFILLSTISNLIGLIFPLFFNKNIFLFSEIVCIILFIILYLTDTEFKERKK